MLCTPGSTPTCAAKNIRVKMIICKTFFKNKRLSYLKLQISSNMLVFITRCMCVRTI